MDYTGDRTDGLINPYGGQLCDLLVDAGPASDLRSSSTSWPSWDLDDRQICDLELLVNGGFSPLRGFMSRSDYESVCSKMRLADGTLWPIPITLEVSEDFAKKLAPGDQVALRDSEGVMLAVLDVEEVWRPDLTSEAELVFGTTDSRHPGAARLARMEGSYYVGGSVQGVHLPLHYDFKALRATPRQLREQFSVDGWSNVVAFQTRNPMHRAHQELTLRAARETGAKLLIHPVVGMTKPGDVDHYTRVRAYSALLHRYPPGDVKLALLPLAMRMGGPREALLHAIVRRNYGCTHLIVGRDHAGPGADSSGKPFYGPYDAQELLSRHEEELGVHMVPFKMMVYLPEKDVYQPDDEVPEGEKTLNISGTELRRMLEEGEEIPEWFSFPDVVAELRRTHPPRRQQGFTVFFTGLSGSGKSTIANVLLVKLLEAGGRRVTLLDGDQVRKHLSSELGFSKEHRDINIRRIGYVAAEITKNGGVAICAPIAPYESVRSDVAQMVGEGGGFILVYASTPLEVCEQRDRKGLYEKARAGIVKEFTGISDPYEVPENADLEIDTTQVSAEEAADRIIAHLTAQGYLVNE